MKLAATGGEQIRFRQATPKPGYESIEFQLTRTEGYPLKALFHVTIFPAPHCDPGRSDPWITVHTSPTSRSPSGSFQLWVTRYMPEWEVSTMDHPFHFPLLSRARLSTPTMTQAFWTFDGKLRKHLPLDPHLGSNLPEHRQAGVGHLGSPDSQYLEALEFGQGLQRSVSDPRLLDRQRAE